MRTKLLQQAQEEQANEKVYHLKHSQPNSSQNNRREAGGYVNHLCIELEGLWHSFRLHDLIGFEE